MFWTSKIFYRMKLQSKKLTTDSVESYIDETFHKIPVNKIKSEVKSAVKLEFDKKKCY